MKKTFKIKYVYFTVLLIIIAIPSFSLAQEEKEAIKLEQITVTAPGEKEGVTITPQSTIINVKEYKTPGAPQNVVDILKDRAIVDFRGQSDLVPSNDTIQMRGFGGRRFITAIDGLTIEKSGFGYGNHSVDYATVPLGQIESIEIMPGPHSALYPGQSIGGVLNLVTRTPEKYPTLKPDFKVATSYRSYDTQNHNVNVDGGVGSFIYGFGFQNYHTDGYLRHNETDIDTFTGTLGYILPSDGYISLSTSYTDQDKESVVKNDPSKPGYKSIYPKTPTARREEWQDPTTDKEAYSYRLKWKQPTPIGIWTLGAYYNDEKKESFFLEYKDRKDPTKGVKPGGWGGAEWDQWGGRIQDEIKFSENHISTVGFDMVVGHGESSTVSRHKRLDRKAGYLQHKWTMIPRLKLVAGLRYEDVDTWTNNRSTRTASGYYNSARKQDYIKRHFSEFVPKSFLTYELDDVSDMLRDTSLSLGVSKIWHAPTSGMDMHGYGLPGFYLDPEHGIAYDLVLMRRLWKDINLKVNYAFYEIRDYITLSANRKYAKYIPSKSNPVPPGIEYSDAKINLEKVHRHGVEVELNGHILSNLSFYLSYAWQDLESKGPELAGKEELDDRAKYRVNAGLRYSLFKNTLLMLDYKFQDEQVAYSAEEVEEDVWVFYSVPMDSYDVFDFAVEQTLFKEYGFIKDGVLKFYVNNLFDEDYENSRGYPMTDRTIGGAISFRF